MFRVRAEEKKLELRLIYSGEIPRNVLADSFRLQQALINLLSNALKYTKEGSITVRLHSESASAPGHALLVYEVEDTGVGIPAEDQERIFEPFVQVKTAEIHKGAGLGLTITRRLIELMGGAVEVRSEPGKGACFRLQIPVEGATGKEARRLESEAGEIFQLEAGQTESRVLVVDDEPDNWIPLKRLLEHAGFVVQTAENALDGVKIFREWRPHFIWMDLRLPDLDGFEATRIIRASEGGLVVKIAALTASGFLSERDKALAAGMDDYLCKPYRPREVFECLGRHLGVRYQREDTSSVRSSGAGSGSYPT
jgi:CheY-like chemotaxis protein/anti-sigma regulatory factor (Ser/Thr protein kinase)